MHPRRSLGLLLIATTSGWGPAWAGASAAVGSGSVLDGRAWLERIRVAAKERNYQGTMVFTAGDVVTSSRIGHYCVGDERFERVEALGGQQQRVYRHNDLVHTLWPERRVATVERRDGVTEELGLPEIDPRLQEHYDVRTLASDRVAGRDAQVLLLKPRDGARFAQRLWADASTGLLLRADILGASGQVLESVAFSDVEIGSRSQRESVRAPMKNLAGYRVITLNPVATRLESEGWALGGLPAGFQIVGCVRRGVGDPLEIASSPRPPEALQVVLSDGLARVSLFIEPQDPARRRRPLMTQMGATHTVMRQMRDRWWITAMGDVPMPTLLQLLSSLERRP